MIPVLAETPLSVRVANQAASAMKSGSSWVIAVVVSLGLFYQSLTDVQQAALIASLPGFLKGYGLILTPAIGWLVTRLKPSAALSPQTQALVDEVTRLRLNEYLVKNGAPPVAAPASPILAPVLVPAPAPIAEAPIPPPAPVAPPAPAIAVIDRMLNSVKAGPPAPVPDTTRDRSYEGYSVSGPELRALVAALMPAGTPNSAIDTVLRTQLVAMGKSADTRP